MLYKNNIDSYNYYGRKNYTTVTRLTLESVLCVYFPKSLPSSENRVDLDLLASRSGSTLSVTHT